MTPEASFYFSVQPHFLGEPGARVAVRVFGEGKPLVLVHGFPLHGFTYRHLLPQLSKRYRCFVFDLLGAGDSEWTDSADFSFPAQAQRVGEAMTTLGVSRYAILAHDTGASVARHVALQDSGRVERMILINTEVPGHRPPWIPFYGKFLAMPGSAFFLQQLLRSRLFLRSSAGFGGSFSDLKLIDGDFREHFVRPIVTTHHKAAGYGRYLCGFDWKESDGLAHRHSQITAPVLMLWGQDDPTFPEPEGRRLAAQLPNCVNFVTIPNAKLLPHEEQPTEVLFHVEAFLANKQT